MTTTDVPAADTDAATLGSRESEDGPDDPANPMNWPKSNKNLHIIIVGIFTLSANLASTMFAPRAEELGREFNITNSTVRSIQSLYGRLIMYYACNIVYFAFTVGYAFSTNTAMFIVFRFISGTAASGPMGIGARTSHCTVADVTPQEERGRAIALFGFGPLLGTVLGPIIGGFVSETIGCRWSFRLILILSGVFLAAILIFMQETSASVLLRRKAERLRKETGNDRLLAKGDTGQTPRQMMRLLFGLIFLLFTTFPQVFGETYGFNVVISGLAYLGLGIGLMAALILFAALSDKLLGQKRDGKVAQAEERLILMKWFAPFTPLGCFLYGWTAYYQVHWIVPIIGTFILGFGTLFVIIPAQTYLVDVFGAEAGASALAANLVIRQLGLGRGNSVLGFNCLAFMPVPWIFYRYGKAWRNRFAVEW
ncbi:MFS general substrate transporter [Eremomyces bilateralis CBS 781.70]|uniref:MFS general substrate transporter n=1 Tax=Eremomyces bilateralis CBS 781.70 TaxID=1392243 RepID=A0A6G1GCU6_9PEZI|nr:MFS general substrate transporter [Eremomyces bilateralis CBS 781.70]KAF1815726.1 MFS general substrate transporter [Eremomyces bilateralis CBS 781.70]